jgi:uncharacterized tellurite resistance protein B-like protein
MAYKIDERMRTSLVHMLHTLAKQDGVLHRNEMHFIQGILEEYEYDVSILDETPENFDVNEVVLPADYAERMEMLYNLLYLMKLDAKVSQFEVRFIRRLTLKFSIDPKLVEELVSIMSEYEDKLIPKKLILDTIKKYMN